MKCKMCNTPHRRVGKKIREYGNFCRECFAMVEAFFTVQQFNNHLFYWSGTETTKMIGNIRKDGRVVTENLEFWK